MTNSTAVSPVLTNSAKEYEVWPSGIYLILIYLIPLSELKLDRRDKD
jgi:hypothetical protein